MAAQNFLRLGECLSDEFTVIVPDRRGRGTSGPFGEHYAVARDCEDVEALVERTGARGVFGLSSGAIIALEAALRVDAIERVALYEPPFSVGNRDNAHWAPRHAREIERGAIGAAMLTVMKGTGDSRLLRLLPYWPAARFFDLLLRFDADRVAPGDTPIAALVPTMQYDARIVKEASPHLERFRALRSDVLLLGGSESAAFLGAAMDAIEEILPRRSRVVLPGVGHTAADNHGKPEMVAAALRAFFAR